MQPRAALFELISGRASWLAQRQAVLTRNVANADTPGFVPLDLAPADTAQLVRAGAAAGQGGLGLLRTAPAHVAGIGATEQQGYREEKAETYEVKPAGNSVVLAEEMQKMATTDLDYQLATNLYRRYVGLLRTALGAAPQG
jgi:flagellar basal-body rod protein FlgB